jgi:hypothetical protein
MEYVYRLLEEELETLTEKVKNCECLEEKSELIGNKILVDHSLNLLRKCEQHDIRAGSIFTKLPPKQCDTPSCDYRVIEDGETDDSKYWYEVEISGKQFGNVRLHEGDVVIEL